MTNRRYKTDTIIEAIVQFNFRGGQKWDLTYPGRMYELLKTQGFPDTATRQVMSVQQLADSANGVGQLSQRSIERAWYISADKKSIVQFGQDLCSVHRQGPYQGWEALFGHARLALDALKETTEIRLFESVRVQYTNEIALESATSRVSEFLTFHPSAANLKSGLPDFQVVSLNQDIEMLFTQDPCVARISSAALDRPPFGAVGLAIAVDTAFPASAEPPHYDIDQALAVAVALHDRENSVFEACITDRQRERMEVIS